MTDTEMDAAQQALGWRWPVQQGIWHDLIAPHNNEWTTWSDACAITDHVAKVLEANDYVVVKPDLIEKLVDAVSTSADFFNARDEMNAAVHTPSLLRLSPITVMVNEALQAWREWKFGTPPQGGEMKPDA